MTACTDEQAQRAAAPSHLAKPTYRSATRMQKTSKSAQPPIERLTMTRTGGTFAHAVWRARSKSWAAEWLIDSCRRCEDDE